MAAAPAVIVVLSLLLISWSCHAEDGPAILLRVVDAVEKLIRFYKASYQHIDLDGVYSLKILEVTETKIMKILTDVPNLRITQCAGQIQQVLDEHRQGKHVSLSLNVVPRLRAVLEDARWVAEKAVPVMRDDDRKYFQDLAFLVTKPWTLFKQHRKIIPSLRWEIPVYNSGAKFAISKAESEKCMREMRATNTTEVKGGNHWHCGLTEQCGLIMTKRGLTEYSITRQILWTALAEQMECGTEMNTLLKKLGFQSIDSIQEEFCTNSYYEMLAVVHVYMSGTIESSYQDVFLEQQFLCPNLGFYEFLKKKYLDQILTWQLPSGCFGNDPEDESTSQEEKFPRIDSKNAGMLEKTKSAPNINSLYDSKQHLNQQVKDLQSNKEIGKPKLHQPDSKKVQVNVLHQPLQKMNVKRSAVPDNEHHIHIAKETNLHLAKGRSAVIVNQPPAQQQHPKLNKVANRIPMKQEQPVSHVKLADQKLQAPLSVHKKQQPGNQNTAAELSNMNIAKRTQLKYENKPNVQNNMAGKLSDSRISQVSSSHKGHKQLQVPYFQNTVKGGASAIKIPERSRDALRPVLVPGRSQHSQRSQAALLNMHTAGQEHKRKLLMEKELTGHCLIHKTSMAGRVLVIYLRYLIDPGPMDLFGPHDFFPDASRNLLGSEKSYQGMMNLIANQMQNVAGDKDKQAKFEKVIGLSQQDKERADANDDDEEEEEEEEEDDEEDGEYEDREELYPDAGEEAGRQQERKVVHFGANNNPPHRHQDNYADNRPDENDEYPDENEDNEEGGDYIKRVKGEDDRGDNTIEKENVDDDTEYTYYDDDDDTDRGIIKRHKPQGPPQQGARIRTHNRHKPHPPNIDQVPMGLPDSPPTKTVMVLLSATSLLVIVFMYRFIRKRRVHFRYSSRDFFKL